MGQGWEGMARPRRTLTLLLPGTFQGLSASPPRLAPSYSEALGLFGETPPPTLPLPGNSCGWMRGWEPGRHGGGVRPSKGEREEGGVHGCAQRKLEN